MVFLVIVLKTVVFETVGIDNLKVVETSKPLVGSHEVLVQIKIAAVNPIDSFVVTGRRPAKPIPHTPGSEFAGMVEDVGEHVTSVKRGDRVTVYNRVFDSSCDMCISGNENLCRNGGIIGVVVNGGYKEYATISERNIFRIPDNMTWELAASLPVSALTSLHALNEAEISMGEKLVVFGASGNTGMFAVQLGKKCGATVIAVTRKRWLEEFGADKTIGMGEEEAQMRTITNGKMADVVLNSLGSETWSRAFNTLGVRGRLVFFGTLTGGTTQLDLDKMHNRQVRIIGTTGGTRKELQELIQISDTLKVKVWRKFKFEQVSEALKSLFSKERDGRIFLEF
jgi:NADPH:quinone reductase-like Zn-dependent oxidoreductase